MFDPDEVFPIKNGTKINLLSWKTQKYLNSHTVAAPVSKDLLEVTGYINHNVGMEPEVSKGGINSVITRAVVDMGGDTATPSRGVDERPGRGAAKTCQLWENADCDWEEISR